VIRQLNVATVTWDEAVNPGVRTVIRLFETRLAEKVRDV
jgi:hypothetical protein